MARNRLPTAKALVSGAAAKNPKRYPASSSATQPRAIGAPYEGMTDGEKEAWNELAGDMPWLNAAHRTLLRLACILTARLHSGEFGVQATQALSSILSKLGATPVDSARVASRGDDEVDPADRFFGRTH